MLALKRRTPRDFRLVTPTQPWTDAFIDFVKHCFGQLPRGSGKRDIRRQTILRALYRMLDAGKLPFKIEGDCFVF
jgi:hypothetical protein